MPMSFMIQSNVLPILLQLDFRATISVPMLAGRFRLPFSLFVETHTSGTASLSGKATIQFASPCTLRFSSMLSSFEEFWLEQRQGAALTLSILWCTIRFWLIHSCNMWLNRNNTVDKEPLVMTTQNASKWLKQNVFVAILCWHWMPRAWTLCTSGGKILMQKIRCAYAFATDFIIITFI